MCFIQKSHKNVISSSVYISVNCFESLCLAVSVGWAKYILSEVCDVGTPRALSQLGAHSAYRVLGRCLDERSLSVPWWSVSDLSTVGYAPTNVIGSRTSFIVASVRSNIHWNICMVNPFPAHSLQQSYHPTQLFMIQYQKYKRKNNIKWIYLTFIHCTNKQITELNW